MDQKQETEISHPQVTLHIQNEKPKRQRLKVGDPDFEPPDGGWGWMIVIACGFSNLCTFPMFQQFGLVFRKRFEELEISHSQTTSIINMNSAFNAGMGLTNGPLFRRFSYRQVAMFGSLLVATSLLLCRFCDSFWGYMILYSACYGSGIGITQSSNALALNTYFRKKRRIATGFSWTTTGLGPVVWPYIIVLLNSVYGINGTILMFAGLALHAFACSLLLQPVERHTKFRDTSPESFQLLENGHQTKAKEKAHNEWVRLRKKKRAIISSQYLMKEDDPIHTGYEITDPGTPMMIKSNDGWYSRSNLGSRTSLAMSSRFPSGAVSRQSSVIVSNRASAQNSMPVSTRPSYANLLIDSSKIKTPNHSYVNLHEFGKESGKERSSSQARRKLSQVKNPGPSIIEEQEYDVKNEEMISANQEPHRERDILKEAAKKLEEYKEDQDHEEKHLQEQAVRDDKNLSIWKKISIFFDFELFKDPIYVNLMLGITIANFAELNFSILTPMVLREFKFEEFQTATFMSLLGATDILVRFFIPFIADKIGWDNKTFFLIGVMAMALGRIILVHTQTYGIGLFVAAMIGAGKGLRTIFIALVIPSYVPLDRLPAASGLQLATSGLLFIILGPVVGWVRQIVGNYVITLHLLNLCTYFTAICWTVEMIITKNRKKPGDEPATTPPNSEAGSELSSRKPSKSFKT